MRPFDYHRAADPRAAVAAVARRPEARFLAGGTNLIDLMRLGVEAPELLVDVSRLGGGRIAETEAGGLLIGASVRNSELAADHRVRDDYPVLAQALLNGASGQLRNLATVAGNLLQRTRCLYFQDVTKPCNKRSPGSGCPAIEGEHANLAIFGHSEHCVATHPSDMAVAMVALDATVHLEGPSGPRTTPLIGFHRLPGDAPDRDTVLHHGELITAVELPPLAAARRSLYRKARERRSFAFALVSVAAALELDRGEVRDARVALGGVAHVPWRATRAEEMLRGGPLTEERAHAAAEAELAHATPLRDNAYKVPLAHRLIVRTLLDVAERP
ncbi:MAG: xanthine dehydrogenase family protein subunit M [Solirubrobacterales bacterium]|nr:xanthine dehydrogenase family protein subunit M [Solirubrobacterales bacterium]MBV9717228.1 xanthine dehydrogenase family protein subunit M [Solirubrobacterales bacterium]